MLIDLLATFSAGAGLAGVILALRYFLKGRLPKWALPAGIGAGMLLFSVWNEYSWYGRTAAALPEEVIILSSPVDKVVYRPWTYLFPVTNRFVALDRTILKQSEVNPAIRRAEAMVVARWARTIRIPLAFDCASGARVDLIEGVTVDPDGRVTGGDWQVVGPQDELQRAACGEGANG